MARIVAIILLTIALLYFPSVQYDLGLDGAETTYYGFPAPWNGRFPATSLVKDIFVVPLVIDLMFYGWISTLLVRAADRHLPRPARIGAMTVLCAWGAWCAILMMFVVSIGSFFHVWPQPGPFEISAIRLGPAV